MAGASSTEQQSAAPDKGNTQHPQNNSTTKAESGAIERLIDDFGSQITIQFEKEPSTDSYEYLRDYFDFKLKRMKSAKDKAA
jgi:hypothetical protein